MQREIPQDFLDVMFTLDDKHWDDITKMWLSGEKEKDDYHKQYYAQIDNLNLNNRTFDENKRMLTPAEMNKQIDERILGHIEQQKAKDFKERCEALTNRFIGESKLLFDLDKSATKDDRQRTGKDDKQPER